MSALAVALAIAGTVATVVIAMCLASPSNARQVVTSWLPETNHNLRARSVAAVTH